MKMNLSESSQANSKRERNKLAMREAIAIFKAEGVPFRQTDQWSLKFGPYNYWPGTGKLFRDGEEHALRDQGPAEITALLKALKALKASVRQDRPPTFE